MLCMEAGHWLTSKARGDAFGKKPIDVMFLPEPIANG